MPEGMIESHEQTNHTSFYVEAVIGWGSPKISAHPKPAPRRRPVGLGILTGLNGASRIAPPNIEGSSRSP
jgi:hypothetical protein